MGLIKAVIWFFRKLLQPSPQKWARSLSTRIAETFSEPFYDTFIYEALTGPTSIRLLALEAGAGEDSGDDILLRCSLREYDINDAPAYKALSYTWKADRLLSERVLKGFIRGEPLGFAKYTLLNSLGLTNVSVRRHIRAKGRSIAKLTRNCGSALRGKLGKIRRSIPWTIRKRLLLRSRKIRSSSRASERATGKLEKKTPRFILCNGKSFHIGSNLYNALRQIPLEKGQLVWIDAICIDQNNVTERSSQVNMMGNIYTKAEKVIVWLGKSTYLTNSGPEFMAKLPSLKKDSAPTERTDLNLTKFRRELKSDPNRAMTVCFTKWTAILLIALRKWFRRVWVLQEIMLANEVSFYLGSHNVSNEDLINGLNWFTYILSRQTINPGGFHMVEYFKKLTGSPRETLKARIQFREDARWTMKDYLIICRGRDSTDPRDMVYAGLSLLDRSYQPQEGAIQIHVDSLNNARSDRIRADYTKSCGQVYQECAESLLYGETGLFVLSLVGSFLRDESDDIPSWVPDFSYFLQPTPFRNYGGVVFATYLSPPEYSVSGTILRLKGINWDEITAVGEDNKDYVLSIGASENGLPGRNLRIISSLGGVYRPTGELAMTAFWRTLLADLFRSEHPAPSSLAQSFTRWLVMLLEVSIRRNRGKLTSRRWRIQNRLQGVAELPDSSRLLEIEAHKFMKDHECPIYRFSNALKRFQTYISDDLFDNNVRIAEYFEPFKSAFDKHCQGRRLFMTRKGYIGLGPTRIKKGDKVMLIAGAYVPYVFRKTDRATVKRGPSVESPVSSLAPIAQDDIRPGELSERLECTQDCKETQPHQPQVEGLRWTLVGEAYVHGIMHSEALLDGSLKPKVIQVV